MVLETAQPATVQLVGEIISLVLYGVLVALGSLAAKLIFTIEKKHKLSIPVGWYEQLQVLIDKGISYADEQAHKLISKGGGQLPSNEKLDLAASYILNVAQQKKLRELGREKLKTMIEARLGESRLVDPAQALEPPTGPTLPVPPRATPTPPPGTPARAVVR